MMPNVKSLLASRNPLQTLQFLKFFPHLESLFLDSVKLTQELLLQTQFNVNLKTMVLRDCQLTNVQLPLFQSLEVLDVSRNNLQNEFADNIKKSAPSLHRICYGLIDSSQIKINSLDVFRKLFLKDNCQFSTRGMVLVDDIVFLL